MSRKAVVAQDENRPVVPGWYGKMPCLGDFASRRLSPEFVDAWDRWLQRSITASRANTGDEWLPAYLTSPVWRFAVMPGVLGFGAWAGVIVPSVDRVGRYFPLTLAVSLQDTRAELRAIHAEHAWFDALEHTGLAALDPDYSVDALEAALAANPYTGDAARNATNGDALAGWSTVVERLPHAFTVPRARELPALLGAAASAIASGCDAPCTFWWHFAPDADDAEVHCCTGLPADDYYAVLIGANARAAISPATLVQLPHM
jgi:type VI secretion system protein ImpM